MKILPILLAVTLAGTTMPAVAQAAPETAPLQAASRNVEVRHQIPDTQDAISIDWLGDVMILSLQSGLKSYDVSDPDRPVLLDHLTLEELVLPGDKPDYFWENEDVNVDPRRKLVFMSRDKWGWATRPSRGRPVSTSCPRRTRAT